MNQTKKSTGPAFPCPENSDEWGIEMRDYFATHAPAVPDDFGWAPGECDSWQRMSRWAYVYADAMIAARSAA